VKVGQAMDVSAGVQHALIFAFATTGRQACDTIALTLPQCSSRNYWCTG